jgi:hypothetical protein
MSRAAAADAAALRAALARPGAVTIADVLACLGAVQASLPRDDGVAAFTRLYAAVTEAVEARAGAGRFRDPAFLSRLDVVFAELYFGALRSFLEDPGGMPRAWAPLVESRGRAGVLPLQFALAGMNAHINRDLPVALVTVCEERGVEPRERSDVHADFLAVNGLLAETEARVKPQLVGGALGLLERRLGTLDDVLAMWNVARARDAAWSNGRALWALRATPALAEEFLRTLDRSVGLAGRGLLRPLPPVRRVLLDRLRRRLGR